MIKLLTFLLVLLPLSTLAKEDNFYLRLDLAAIKLNGIKQDSYISPQVAIGLGYYVDKLYRVDVITENLNLNFYNTFFDVGNVANGTILVGTDKIKRKTYIRSIICNNYFDIINKDNFKIFIGGGIGISRLKEKVTSLFSGSMINGEMQTLPLTTSNYTSKSTSNFIYCFSIGTTININQEVNLDLAYSYKDFGKPKYKREDIPNIPPVKRYKGHNFSIGIRFNL